MKKYILLIIGLCFIISIQAQTWLNSAHIGGSGDATPERMINDEFQNTYISGVFQNELKHDNGNTTIQGKGGTGNDIFIAKYDDQQVELWFQTIGSTLNEGSPQLSFSKDGNILVAGTYNNECYFGNDPEPMLSTGTDIFIAEYDNITGDLLWKKQIVTGTGSQIISSLLVDEDGHIVIGGFTQGPAGFPGYPDALSERMCFLAKYDSNGNYLWHVSFVDQDNTTTKNAARIHGLVKVNDTYFLSGSGKNNLTATGADGLSMDIDKGGNIQLYFYLAAVNEDGHLGWLKAGKSSLTCSPTALVTDGTNLYFSGYYANSDLSYDDSPVGISFAGGTTDVFLFNIDNTGALLSHKSISSIGREWSYGLKIRDNILYTAGGVGATTAFNHDIIVNTVPGSNAMFVATYQVVGNELVAVGATEGIQGNALAKDITFSPKKFVLSAAFQNAINVDVPYTSDGKQDVLIAEACPIIGINTTEIIDVTGCDPSAKNGAIKLDIVGEDGPYEDIIWSKKGVGNLGINSSTIQNIDTGTYTAVVLYNSGFCSKSRDFTIIAPDALGIKDIVVVDAECNVAGSSGSFTVDVVNPSGAPVSYKAVGTVPPVDTETIFDWQSSNFFDNCPPGVYTVSVRFDDLSCEPRHSTTIVASKGTGTLTATVLTNYICNIQNAPEKVGTIKAVANEIQDWFALVDANTGATIVTTTKIKGPNNSVRIDNYTFSDVLPGTYKIKGGLFTENGGCMIESDNIRVTQPKPIVISSAIPADVLCSGGASGRITVRASGAGALTYDLYHGDNHIGPNDNGRFSGLAGATYRLEVSEESSVDPAVTCKATLGNIIVKDVNEKLTLVDASNDACFGKTNGKIVLTARGLTGTKTYTLTGRNANTTGIFANLPADKYKARVLDQTTGCSAEIAEITIAQMEQVLIGTVTHTDVLCKDGNTGTVTIGDITGGTGTYSVALKEVAIFPTVEDNKYTFSGLTKGTYTIQVTDDYDCTASEQTVIVGEPAESLVIGTPVVTKVACFGGKSGIIEILASGGTGTITYELFDSNTTLVETNINGQFNSLAADTYEVIATDANGCSVTRSSIPVTQPEQIIINVTQAINVVCFGDNNGSIKVESEQGVSPIEYSLSYADGSNPQPWQSSNIFSGLTAAAYIVTAKDANSCEQKSEIITISQPAELILTTQVNNISCKTTTEPDGSVVVTVIGGTAPYIFAITGGITSDPQEEPTYSFDKLAVGNYHIVVTDAKGCSKETDQSIAQSVAPSVTAVATDITCFGGNDGSIIATPGEESADLLYCLMHNGNPKSNFQSSNVFTNTSGTDLMLVNEPYQVQVKNASECFSLSEEVIIRQPEKIVVTLTHTDVSVGGVSDGSITATVSGGKLNDGSQYQFQLTAASSLSFAPQNNPHTFDGLGVGIYSVQVKDDNGCIETSVEETIGIKTGIEDMEANSLKIFPNPSDGNFTIQWDSKKNMHVTVEIYGVSGKLVYKTKVAISVGGVRTAVDISKEAKGTYILRVPELEITQKLVIQ